MLAIAIGFSLALASTSATTNPHELPPLEVSYMLFNVYPAPETTLTAPTTISAEGIARLIARSEQTVPFQTPMLLIGKGGQNLRSGCQFQGIEVVLANGTEDSIRVLSRSDHVELIQEALDFDGKWKPIESYQWSDTLPRTPPIFSVAPGVQWSAVAPVYEGSWPTWLRFRLTTTGGHLYSNAFPGRINSMQFRFQEPHHATPYSMSRASHGDKIVVLQHFDIW